MSKDSFISDNNPVFDGAQRLRYRSAVDGAQDWLLIEHGGARGLWVIVLHGHGSSGDQLYTRADMRDFWLPRLREIGAKIVCPNLRGNAWMSPAAVDDLSTIIAWLRREHDARRIILLGASMGGTGALLYAALRPSDVSAIVALCPAADLPSYRNWTAAADASPTVSEIRRAIDVSYTGAPLHSAITNAQALTMPLFVAHGDNDALIPVDQSRLLVKALQGSANFSYVELAGGDHETPLVQAPRGLTTVLDLLDLTGEP